MSTESFVVVQKVAPKDVYAARVKFCVLNVVNVAINNVGIYKQFKIQNFNFNHKKYLEHFF